MPIADGSAVQVLVFCTNRGIGLALHKILHDDNDTPSKSQAQLTWRLVLEEGGLGHGLRGE